MTHLELRRKFFEFWKAKDHVEIPSSSLVPENDPTTLFTGFGMQPLLPYFLGQPHPLGKKVMDAQKCFRAEDINEVGDNRHTTFFEMLGNWSFGAYFKRDQLTWYFEFLTEALGLDPNRLYVTVFSGDERYKALINNKYQPLGPDVETIALWKELFSKYGITAKEKEFGSLENASEAGMGNGRIFSYGVEKNWWSRSGAPGLMPVDEPGGPDSEMFYKFPEVEHDPRFGKKCHPNCDCGRYLEIGNSVFMEYLKIDKETFKELPNKNVDFGGGLERTLAAVSKNPDVFQTSAFAEIIEEIEKDTGKKYTDEDNKAPMRVIADHIKAATFLISDGVAPSNKDRGYVLRRLVRRASVKMHILNGGLTPNFDLIADIVLRMYEGVYFDRNKDRKIVFDILNNEIMKFATTLDKGLKELEKFDGTMNTGLFAFNLFQTFGFPLEVTEELFGQKKTKVDKAQFEKAYKGHQELSRKASAGMFKGGLADHSEIVTKYHTTTHLLQAALRKVLGEHVHQEGSNITAERLRFDFSQPQKLTAEEIKQVEDEVNKQIKNDLPRKTETLTYDAAIKSGALAFFKERYPEKVTVYSFGNFSREICGGPHVEHTGLLGRFKIIKEEAVASGIRRIYGLLE